MKDKNKKIILIIGIVSVILLVSGITYSWFKWRSSNNATVSITIDNSTGLVITFDGGQNITGILEPTLTKEEGIVKNFSANTNGLNVPMNICLKINTLPNDLKDSTFKWELYKGSVLLSNGDFSTEDLSLRTDNGNSDYYLVTDVISDNTSNYTLYLWIDGNFPNNGNMASKSIDFDLYGTVSSTNTNYINAASYINYLYTKAEKTVVQNNNINYHYATSVGLMNDRLGGTTQSLDGGDVRFYGSNPNNYVWLGDVDNGTKKVWRIIGVFDGKLKLSLSNFISYLSWDISPSNVNSGFGINQWGPSGNYEGADLMKLLNPGYENNQDLDSAGNTITVNNSLFWTKGTGTVYNATTSNVSFANTGLSSSEKDMIDDATWYLGASSNSGTLYLNDQYATERQSSILGICSAGNDCNDDVIRTATWTGKVGLIYLSDYGYASDFSTFSGAMYYSYNSATGISNNNWLKAPTGKGQWTISPNASAYYCYLINSNGFLASGKTSTGSLSNLGARPTIYLKSGVVIVSGTGTESNPYVLEYSE